MNDDQILHALHFDDAYEVRSVLADGPGGTTELVFLDGSGPFVRKKIPGELARRGVWSALAECKCRRLPHVVATYELPDSFVAVYDYVPGETLESVVEQKGRLCVEDAVRLMVEVCEAASALHARHVVHRDLSPSNIVIAADGAHVIDLGIARVSTEAPAKNTTKLGTWGFASPEQFGFAQTDARSDVYAMGRVLAYALTGIRPDADDFAGALDRADGIPANVKAVVEKAGSFEPSGRFQSAAEMARALVSCGIGDIVPGAWLARAGTAAGEGEDEAGENAEAAVKTASRDASGAVGEAASQPDDSNDAAPVAAQAGNPAACAPVAEAATAPDGASDARPPHPGEKASRISASAVVKKLPGRGPGRVVSIVACAVGVALVVVLGAGVIGGAFGSGGQSQGVGSTSNGSSKSTSSDGSSPEAGAASGSSGTSSNSSSKNTQSSGSSVTDAAKNTDNPLSIVESGWSMGGNGYVQFVYALRNNSADTTVKLPSITVTGKNSSGEVLFARETAMMSIGAGQTQYYASIEPCSETPASVEFEPQALRSYSLSTSESAGSFSVSNVSESKNQYGETKITGEVTADDVGNTEYGDVMVTVVFRDASGTIVGGAEAFVSCPAQGKSVAFSATPYVEVKHESVEVYACIW